MLEPKQTVETMETPGGARAVAGEGSRPDPELAERAQRRKFTAAYKLRILREAAGATRPGEIASMLRREGLYTSHLTAWRKQQDAGALAGLEPRKRGPSGPSSEQVELRALRARLERAEAELQTARRVIEVQGNVSALLEDLLAPKGALDTQPRPGR
jgi:transposase